MPSEDDNAATQSGVAAREVISAHDILRTYDCKSPTCTNTATSDRGRDRYCFVCQRERGPGRLGGRDRIVPDTPQWHRSQIAKSGRAVERAEADARRALQRVIDARAAHQRAIHEGQVAAR